MSMRKMRMMGLWRRDDCATGVRTLTATHVAEEREIAYRILITTVSSRHLLLDRTLLGFSVNRYRPEHRFPSKLPISSGRELHPRVNPSTYYFAVLVEVEYISHPRSHGKWCTKL